MNMNIAIIFVLPLNNKIDKDCDSYSYHSLLHYLISFHLLIFYHNFEINQAFTHFFVKNIT